MNPDFRDLFNIFNAHRVEYVIVGAHAVAAHGHVRATKDLDVWIRANPENAERAYEALTEFTGGPIQGLRQQDLEAPGLMFQMGTPPIRIDVLTRIDGVQFEDAWQDRLSTKMGGVDVAVISLNHLIQNKRTSGRLQDLADVEQLEKLENDSE